MELIGRRLTRGIGILRAQRADVLAQRRIPAQSGVNPGGKRRGAGRAALILGLLAALILPTEVFGARAVRVRLGTLAPKGSSSFMHLQEMGQTWKEISTGGAQLTTYADGTMGGEADMVRRMRIGQLQAGLLTTVGLAEIDPAVTGLQYLPMMFRSLDEVDYVGRKLQPLLEERLEAKGFKVLFWGDAGWVRFFTKDPVVVPDDLRKSKLFVWAGNADAVSIFKSAGFNPVPLETVDILPNLQTGLITAVPMPPFIALASQVDSVAPYMLDLNWAPLAGALVMTKDTWDKIPAASQGAIVKAAIEAGKKVTADNRKESDEAVEAMKKRGLKVQSVSPEVDAQWRVAVDGVYPSIRGRIVPEEIFDNVVSLLKEFRESGAR